MKHKLFKLMIIVLILSFLGTGCTAPSAPAATAAPAAPAAPVATKAPEPATIAVWHVWSGARQPMLEDMIKDFNVIYPQIKVQNVLLDQNVMAEKYLTAIAGGSPPDVIMVHGANFFQQFAAEGALVPLDDFIKADGMAPEKIFYQAELDTFKWKGVTYGLPLSLGAGNHVFHYDVDAFKAAGLDPDKPPKTWKDLKEYAQKLTIKDGSKFKQVGFLPYSFTNFPFKEWLFLNNGYILSEDGKKVAFNSQEGLDTLTWMVNFYKDLYGGFNNVLDMSGARTANGYMERDIWFNNAVAMHVDGIWHNAQLASSAPKKNVRASLMPYNSDNPKAKVRNIVEGGWSYSIPKGSKNQKAAWLFLKYATAGEGNYSFFKAQGRPSPVVAFNDKPDMSVGNPYWGAYLENIKFTEKTVLTRVQTQVNDIITAMTEEALMGKKTPKQALDDAALAAQKLLDDSNK